jgi:shikimate kinase
MLASNIILIGMPGAGKSTVGRALAARLGFAFRDTDDDLVSKAHMSLQDIMDTKGEAYFRALEQTVILELRASQSVIATGGSVIYSQRGMEHLQDLGTLIYLDVPLRYSRRASTKTALEVSRAAQIKVTRMSTNCEHPFTSNGPQSRSNAIVPTRALAKSRIVLFAHFRSHAG